MQDWERRQTKRWEERAVQKRRLHGLPRQSSLPGLRWLWPCTVAFPITVLRLSNPKGSIFKEQCIRLQKFPEAATTEWAIGSVQDVAWLTMERTPWWLRTGCAGYQRRKDRTH